MAKNGQRSNKEKKKPKQIKPKEAPALSPFAKGQGGAANKSK
jgi:hypothetical protein